MKLNSVMVLRSKGSLGTFHPQTQADSSFYYSRNFYYLTGLNEPEAYLVMYSSPESPTFFQMRDQSLNPTQQILFVMPQNKTRTSWDALPLGIKAAKKTLGFNDARSSKGFQEYLERILMGKRDIIYMDYKRSQGLMAPLTSDEQVFKKARDKGASFALSSPNKILTEMGRVRSQTEIALIKKAVNITAQAQLAAMRSIKPGMLEYQLQAIVEYVYTTNGAQASAFPSIIGSGPNSCILHWGLNSRKMKSGDIVVVYIGAEYNLYGADITRTIPVSGKFSNRQKEVYEIVLTANETAINMVAPGVVFKDISNKAAEIVGEGLAKLGLIKDKKKYRKYYFHGLGHPIGLRVGGWSRMGILEPGMVITIEPGIYIREESLGVRIEDDVLVTETGCEVLSRHVPKTIAEIEELMRQEGLDYNQYLLK
jgi:Xaa-Pro aminopeptidase